MTSTPRELIATAVASLKVAGIPHARLDAELLLSHALGCQRIDLYTHHDNPIKEKDGDQFRKLVERRIKREPLQYIVGETEFYGLKMKVTPTVLIPRPETEVLVEEVIRLVGAAPRGRPGQPHGVAPTLIHILDIGTGTGCIAITLAKQIPHAKIAATDISKEALEVARHNAKLNEVEGQIDFILADIAPWRRFQAEEYLFDLIVSNPPYIPTGEFPNLQPEVRDFEPRKALDGGREGLDFYRTILKDAVRFLKPGGWIFFEVGDGEAGAVQLLMKEADLSEISSKKDLRNLERVVRGRRI